MGQNKTYGVLAEQVGHALEHLKDVEQNLDDARRTVRELEADRANAAEELSSAKAELFEAHPELRPDPPTQSGRQLPIGA